VFVAGGVEVMRLGPVAHCASVYGFSRSQLAVAFYR